LTKPKTIASVAGAELICGEAVCRGNVSRFEASIFESIINVLF
jgi:hypothetical protein